MAELEASLISRDWRKVDIKLRVGDDLHVLRWRRRWFIDEVLFDDRRVATTSGMFGRESIFGLEVKAPTGDARRLLFSIDTQSDWTDWEGSGRPRGVRLETADAALLAIGSLGPDRTEPFKKLFDRAVEAIGLS
jgi:hypothetical protein